MNTLIITVLKIETLKDGSIEYGFTAADEFDSYYEFGWNTLDSFIEQFPNPDALRDYVLTLDKFSALFDAPAYVEWIKDRA